MEVSFSKFEKYHQDYVVMLIKEGNFYSCYLEDAYVMNYLFSFKLIYSNHLVKISFSKVILDRIRRILELRNCSYSILSEQLIHFYLPHNQYLKYLEQENYQKDKLLSSLSKLSYLELLSITQDSFK